MPHPDMNELFTNGHPDEGLLHEWLDEQLSAADASTVAAHVTECAECSAAVAEARGLIAASHRILSALDDVPAGVIPQTMQPAAQTSDAAIDFNKRVEELRVERAMVASTPLPRSLRSGSRWRQAGKVAALMLIAVVPGVYFLRGGEKTAPIAASGASTLATTERSAAQPDAAAPQSKPDVAPASGGAASDFAVAEPLAKSARVADKRAENVPASAAPPPPRQLRDDAETQNAAESRVALAPSVTDAASAASAPSVEAAKKSASNTAAKAVEIPRPSATSPMLSGKVAGVVIAPQDRARDAAAGAVVQRSMPANAAAASPPIPQVANAPAPVAQGAARTQSPDTLGSSQAIAAAVRRVSDAEANRETPPIAARAQLRAEFSATSPGAPFDSVIVTRTNCGTSCETSVLHVTLNGAVRFTVSSGSSRSLPAFAQLSASERNGLRRVILAELPNAFTAPESMRCTVGRPSGAPLLDLLIARTPLRIAERGDASMYRCAADGALIRLGATIDSIARTSELRRRIP